MKITKIEWPTVAAMGLVLAAGVVVWVTAEAPHREEILSGLAAIGLPLLAIMRAAVVVEGKPPAPPPSAVLLALALPLAAASQGCGPSALATHARVYAFAAVTLEASQASLVAACTSARDACSGDAACLADAESECRAAALAQDATRDAVATYEGVIRAAVLADSGDVMGSLMVALSLAASAWASLGARLADVGLSLPALPAWVSGAIGGAQ